MKAMTTHQFDLRYYGPDGGADMSEAGQYFRAKYEEQTFPTLASARAAIREAVGGRMFGRWGGEQEGDAFLVVEAWHESRAEGCGGWVIRDLGCSA